MSLHNKIDKRVLKAQLAESTEARKTLSFYRYVHIANPELFRDHLYSAFDQVGVMGRIYVAAEGINAQISIPAEQEEAFLATVNGIDYLKGIRLNWAIEDDGKSFFKLKIKMREKIVADGLDVEDFDVTDGGDHLDAARFNTITDNPDTIVVDMRNHYESEVGHFENALTPDVDTFREALLKVEEELVDQKDKPIVMYCTGGIRCEKASAYYKYKGFKEVYQLDGGIIEYSRQVKENGLRNKFRGKNFVFDERMGEKISDEVISHCHQCGKPCDTHVNCVNEACHLLFIQCDECAERMENTCCSDCQEFIHLPEEQRKALRKGIVLNDRAYRKGRGSQFRFPKAPADKEEA